MSRGQERVRLLRIDVAFPKTGEPEEVSSPDPVRRLLKVGTACPNIPLIPKLICSELDTPDSELVSSEATIFIILMLHVTQVKIPLSGRVAARENLTAAPRVRHF